MSPQRWWSQKGSNIWSGGLEEDVRAGTLELVKYQMSFFLKALANLQVSHSLLLGNKWPQSQGGAVFTWRI